MALSRQRIYEGIRADLIDALGVDDYEVTEQAVLTDDLGAESIDFLDIEFRLERRFNISLRRDELFPLTTPRMLSGEYVDFSDSSNLKLTAQGAAYLRESPAFKQRTITAGMRLSDLTNNITVGALVNYLEAKLNQPDN